MEWTRPLPTRSRSNPTSTRAFKASSAMKRFLPQAFLVLLLGPLASAKQPIERTLVNGKSSMRLLILAKHRICLERIRTFSSSRLWMSLSGRKAMLNLVGTIPMQVFKVGLIIRCRNSKQPFK